MTQAKLNHIIANDPYLSVLAKECVQDATNSESLSIKIRSDVLDLATSMFLTRVEVDETPLERVKFSEKHIRKALVQF